MQERTGTGIMSCRASLRARVAQSLCRTSITMQMLVGMMTTASAAIMRLHHQKKQLHQKQVRSPFCYQTD